MAASRRRRPQVHPSGALIVIYASDLEITEAKVKSAALEVESVPDAREQIDNNLTGDLLLAGRGTPAVHHERL